MASFLDNLDLWWSQYDYVVDIILFLFLTHFFTSVISRNILARKIRRILKTTASPKWKLELIEDEVK